jgi:hypothetical protein
MKTVKLSLATAAGLATTTLTSPSGAVVSSFRSVSAGVRMPR